MPCLIWRALDSFASMPDISKDMSSITPTTRRKSPCFRGGSPHSSYYERPCIRRIDPATRSFDTSGPVNMMPSGNTPYRCKVAPAILPGIENAARSATEFST